MIRGVNLSVLIMIFYRTKIKEVFEYTLVSKHNGKIMQKQKIFYVVTLSNVL